MLRGGLSVPKDIPDSFASPCLRTVGSCCLGPCNLGRERRTFCPSSPWATRRGKGGQPLVREKHVAGTLKWYTSVMPWTRRPCPRPSFPVSSEPRPWFLFPPAPASSPGCYWLASLRRGGSGCALPWSGLICEKKKAPLSFEKSTSVGSLSSLQVAIRWVQQLVHSVDSLPGASQWLALGPQFSFCTRPSIP